MSACARLDPANTGQTPRPPRLGEPAAPYAPQSAMITVAASEEATRQTPQASFERVPAFARRSKVVRPTPHRRGRRPRLTSWRSTFQAPDCSFLRPVRGSRPRPRTRFEPHRRRQRPTGKSQLLKLLYACTRTLKDAGNLTKKKLSSDLAFKLIGTFWPESLGRLTRRKRGTSQAMVSLKYEGIGDPLSFTFNSRSRREVILDSLPHRELDDEPVFLPSHKLLSLGARFIGLYDAYETGFEDRWRDTVERLRRPALRGPEASAPTTSFAPSPDSFKAARRRGRRTVLSAPARHRKSRGPLVAEGHRKLATVVRLISSGVLLEREYLFRDEPGANLNPASQRAVARALVGWRAAVHRSSSRRTACSYCANCKCPPTRSRRSSSPSAARLRRRRSPQRQSSPKHLTTSTPSHTSQLSKRS